MPNLATWHSTLQKKNNHQVTIKFMHFNVHLLLIHSLQLHEIDILAFLSFQM